MMSVVFVRKVIEKVFIFDIYLISALLLDNIFFVSTTAHKLNRLSMRNSAFL